VAGIVGAGGNLGGMMFGFLFKSDSISYVQAFTYIGYVVIAISCIVMLTRFTRQPAAEDAPVTTPVAVS